MLYLGLMSGTSMDGIDAVLLQIDPPAMRLRAAAHHAWPAPLAQRLRQAAEQPERVGLDELGALDAASAAEFASAAEGLLRAAQLRAGDVRAVGCHGQTLLHRPRAALPFTLQIGDPNRIAERLGIDVVADFRRRDMAAGGEGAPLAPAFHQAAFAAAGEVRAVLNLGGIANVTRLDPHAAVIGFDTGPGNCLMDAWTRRQLNLPFDRHGAWAASGRIRPELLARLLDEPFFATAPPKSTGRDLFSDAWLEQRLRGLALRSEDVQATLAELTALSVAAALCREHAPARVLVCGGGAYNPYLLTRLGHALPGVPVTSTAEAGIAPEHVEAAAFAWLAHRRLSGEAGNLPSVTGARAPVPLGAVYAGRLGPAGAVTKT